MSRWKLTLEYDGSAYSGWQKQPDAVTIQQTLEQAIEKFAEEPVTLHVAGRTDAGVHARAQVAHVDIAKDTNGETVRDAINFYLRPHRISVLNAEQVDKSFHARFDALGRAYRYRIVNRRAPMALYGEYAWQIYRPIDADAMQEAARHLLGMHDFSTFRAQLCQSKSPVRTLDRLDVVRDGDEITIFAEARSFLYHQVRNMVGTLSVVGSGQWTMDQFKSAFAARDRSQGGPTAPPQGLCFWSVSYPQK